MGNFFIQSRFGNRGNFEFVMPRSSGGLVHFWRDNDSSSFTWHGPSQVTSSTVQFRSVSLIQSNFSAAGNGPGNLEVIAAPNSPGALYYLSRPDNSINWQWPSQILSPPAYVNAVSLIQSKFGIRGNFEIIASLYTGPELSIGLTHYYRDNDDSNLPWLGGTSFSPGPHGSCSLIQSSFSAAGNGPGNLEVIEGLGHWWRPDVGLTGTPADWRRTQDQIGTGSIYDVSFIQSRFGNQRRNFEVVAALSTGGLVHFWRDNDSSFTWYGPNSITMNTDVFSDVSLIQSNLSSAGNGPGNLEVIARRQSDNQIFHFSRPDTPAANWQGPGYVPGT